MYVDTHTYIATKWRSSGTNLSVENNLPMECCCHQSKSEEKCEQILLFIRHVLLRMCHWRSKVSKDQSSLLPHLEGCPVLPSNVLTGCQNNHWPLTNSRPWGQDKGVCHFKARIKKKQWNIHSLSLALTLTAILSLNHYTTSNFGRPCTQFRLTVSSQDTMLPRLP